MLYGKYSYGLTNNNVIALASGLSVVDRKRTPSLSKVISCFLKYGMRYRADRLGKPRTKSDKYFNAHFTRPTR